MPSNVFSDFLALSRPNLVGEHEDSPHPSTFLSLMDKLCFILPLFDPKFNKPLFKCCIMGEVVGKKQQGTQIFNRLA